MPPSLPPLHRWFPFSAGPYTYQDTAVNITSSNPAPVVLVKDKYKYAMFHIFNGTEVHVEHCYPNGSRIWPYPPHAVDSGTAAMALSPSKAAEVSNGASASRASGIPRTRQLGADWRNHQISVSDSLDGPWELLQPAPGDAFPTCNNPAPWVHPNGTLYCLCGGSLRRADTITGPWQNVSDLVPKGHVWPLPKGWHHESVTTVDPVFVDGAGVGAGDVGVGVGVGVGCLLPLGTSCMRHLELTYFPFVCAASSSPPLLSLLLLPLLLFWAEMHFCSQLSADGTPSFTLACRTALRGQATTAQPLLFRRTCSLLMGSLGMDPRFLLTVRNKLPPIHFVCA